MIKNYFKIALRNISHQKLFSFINLFGLSAGISICILIVLYVIDEMGYDKFHVDAERIYRIHQINFNPDGSVEDRSPYLPMPMAPALEREIPEIEESVRLWEETVNIRIGDNFIEEKILFTDPEILTIFTFPLIKGDPATAFNELNSIVISESASDKLFGKTDPMNKEISVLIKGSSTRYIVKGVAKNVPGNSSVPFNFLAPLKTILPHYAWLSSAEENWQLSAFITYVKLKEKSLASEATEKLEKFRKKYYPDELDKQKEQGYTDVRESAYSLQPLIDVHLNTEIEDGLVAPSSPVYSYILAGIALGILFIACINFMILSIGRSARRSKEVGVRKVIGASRAQLVKQFWGEALILSTAAFLLAIAMVEVFLPVFNELSVKQLSFNLFNNWELLLVLLLLILFTGLVAGVYPALVLSSFKPIGILKNREAKQSSGIFIKSLVVIQFSLSIFLIISSIFMGRQLNYLQNKNLGYNDENILVINTRVNPDSERIVKLFQDKFSGREEIGGITASNYSFGKGLMRNSFPYKGELKQIVIYSVLPNFIEVMGMELVAGSDIDPTRVSDTKNYILVNEALVKDFNLKNPIGEVITNLTGSPATDPVIAGVVKDFNFQSLKEKIAPVLFWYRPSDNVGAVLVKLKNKNLNRLVKEFKEFWTELYPEIPFTYSFLDEDLQKLYVSEQRWNGIINYASMFAILIACMGLFGLSSLAVTNRTKEIGIRKVLGATVTGITALLSKGLLKLVIAANIVAWPGAYYAANEWLKEFAYKINIELDIFLLASAVTLLISFMTIGYHAVKAAFANPVNSLKYE